MKFLVQRVKEASVTVEEKVTGKINIAVRKSSAADGL